MDVALQVLLALLVPIGWGLLSAFIFDKLRARRSRDAEACEENIVANPEISPR